MQSLVLARQKYTHTLRIYVDPGLGVMIFEVAPNKSIKKSMFQLNLPINIRLDTIANTPRGYF